MRNKPIVLDCLRGTVSNVPNFLESKRMLNEIFLNYTTSQLYLESDSSYRANATFMATLFNDLLDELFNESLQKTNIKPCNN